MRGAHALSASATAYTIAYSYASNTNFNAASDATTTLTLNRRTLTVTAAGQNKPYDGTNGATVTLSDNRVAGDVFTATSTTATFSDKNVGVGKSIAVSGISLSGADAGNYAPNATANAAANITPELVTNGTSAADSITLVQDPDQAHVDWFLNGSSTLGQLATTDLGGLTMNGNGGSDSITVNAGAWPNILHLNGTFTISGLAASNPLGNSTLEIGRSIVYISYSASDPLSLIQGYLKNGYNNGAWNGTPTASAGVITSTPAHNNALQTTAIGYADSADGLIPGQPFNTVELKYTPYGDTTLAGTVGSNDFTTLTQHYHQTTGGTWDTGDFNYDGSVNFNDFTLLTRTYNTSLGSQASPATAGTPTSSGTTAPGTGGTSPSPAPTSHHASPPRRPKKHQR